MANPPDHPAAPPLAAAAGTDPPRFLLPLRVALAVGYPLLAHWASVSESGHSGVIAAVALADLAVIVLLQPLAQRRGWAWALLALLLAALFPLARGPHAQMLLLAPPTLFTGLLAWWFGRSLADPRGALITRIVSALERRPPAQLEPRLQRYTRRLTAAWAGLLALLSLTNATLAVLAVPGGVLARLGHPPAWGIDQAHWSWFANLLDYGLVALLFGGEFMLRQRLFPGRYRSFGDFLQRMRALGPAFWRDFLH